MTETRRIDYAVAPDGKSVKITGQTHGVIASVCQAIDNAIAEAAKPAAMQPPFEGGGGWVWR